MRPHLPTVFRPQRHNGTDDIVEAALAAARGARPEGILLWTDRPRRLLGQSGLPWETFDGTLASALVVEVDPGDDPAQIAPMAVTATGAALGGFVSAMTALSYRWPNDVLLDGAKVAAVRLAQAATGSPYLVVGIQVNAGRCPDNTPFPATALPLHCEDEAPEPVAVLEAVWRSFHHHAERLLEDGFPWVRERWSRRLDAWPDTIRVRGAGESIHGTPAGVDEDGALRLRQADGRIQRISLARFFGLQAPAQRTD